MGKIDQTFIRIADHYAQSKNAFYKCSITCTVETPDYSHCQTHFSWYLSFISRPVGWKPAYQRFLKSLAMHKVAVQNKSVRTRNPI